MVKMANVRNFMRKMFKFGLFIPLSNLILTYGGRYLPDNLLRSVSDRRNRKIRKIVLRVTKYDGSQHCSTDDASVAGGQEKVWFFWMQGESNMPSVPRLCLRYLRKNACGHPVVVLTKDNIKEYANIPERIYELWNKGIITTTHFSDILRFALLSQQGGFWIDATMLVIRPLGNDIFDKPLFTVKIRPFGHFVSRCRWTGFCIASRKGGELATKAYGLLVDYWENTDVQVDYFLIDHVLNILYETVSAIRKEIDEIPYSNEHMHGLNRLLCDDFDAWRYEELTADGTYMFKLSWKTYTEEQLRSNPRSYYNYLLKNL